MTHGSTERVIYQDSAVTITTTRAVFNGTTYAMANITSVRTFVQPSNIGCAAGIALVGALLGLPMAFRGVGGGWFLLLVAIAAGFWAYRNRKSTHWVRIGTAGAETNAIGSKDSAWTARVVAALTDAIVARG